MFIGLSPEEKQAYYRRAETRKVEIMKGWKNINDIVVDYIISNISRDVSELQFIEQI